MQAPVIIKDKNDPLKLLIQGGAGGTILCVPAIRKEEKKWFNSGTDNCSNIIPYFNIDAGLSYVLPLWATIISLKGGLFGAFPPLEDMRFLMLSRATLSLGWKIDDILIELSAFFFLPLNLKADKNIDPLLPNLSVTFPLKEW